MALDPRDEPYVKTLAGVDARWDAARTERALAGLHRRRVRRRAGTMATTALVLVAAFGGWRLAARPTPGPVANETRADLTDRVVRLADGSRVVPEEGATVVVEHVTDSLIAVRVDRGAVDVDVVPGLPRRFEVRAGAVTVTVLGTSFRVDRIDAVHARVSVARGHVDVAWPAGHAELFTGDEGTFPRAQQADPEPVRADPIEPPHEPVEATVERPRPPVRPDPDVTEPRPSGAWRELARASQYDAAYVAMGGPAERAREVTDAVDDLLLAADVARLSGHPAEALSWLEAVEREHASDPRAVLAAFTRGRLLMDLGRPRDAALQLERTLAMEPHGSLAEDALARAALAHAAAGDDARAAALAERYVASYPSGRWSTRVRAITTLP